MMKKVLSVLSVLAFCLTLTIYGSDQKKKTTPKAPAKTTAKAPAKQGRPAQGQHGRPNTQARGNQTTYRGEARRGQNAAIRHDVHGRPYNAHFYGVNNRMRFSRGYGAYHRMWGGRDCFFFGDNWFFCSFWPQWFYSMACYFELGPDGLWYCRAYGHPEFFVVVGVQEEE